MASRSSTTVDRLLVCVSLNGHLRKMQVCKDAGGVDLASYEIGCSGKASCSRARQSLVTKLMMIDLRMPGIGLASKP